MERQIEERLNLLHAWQQSYNMEPRSDSQLTNMYINGEIDWPVDSVARELMATHFIYEETLYGEILQEFLRGVAHRIHIEYKLSWASTWKIVRFYGPMACKLLCVESAGVHIPQKLKPMERAIHSL
jgi:hypothetical protein